MEKVDIEEERASLLSSRLLCAEAIYEPQAIASLAVFQCFQSSSVFSVQVSLAHLVSFFFFLCVYFMCFGADERTLGNNHEDFLIFRV